MKRQEEIYQLMDLTNNHDIHLPDLHVEAEAIVKILPYLKKNNFNKVVLVVDKNTYQAAGKKVEGLLQHTGIITQLICVKETSHQQVIADEQSLVQVMVETRSDTDLFIAVGSGTIHDIVRFAAFKMTIPFISVPTAASVDGFTSKGAPLIFRGVKQTIQTASPLAVFADLAVLSAAPKQLTAAGFGDILGKYTSLLDWKISHLIGGEPYFELAAQMTRKSLETCVNHIDKIARHDQEGIKLLIQALIESGLVMLVLNFSRPASGGEHHLSHYWEMDLLKKDKEQLLHGAKVGVATTLISQLYKDFALRFDPRDVPRNHNYYENISQHWPEIKALISQLPLAKDLKKLLEKVGGPQTTEQLFLSNTLIEASLNEAHHLRDRCTGLYIMNQFKKSRISYPLN